MDPLSEASGGGGRVIAVRHISTDKPITHAGDHINTTVVCHGYSIQPDFYTYFTALQNYAWVLWSTEVVVFLAICVLYAVTMRSALKHWRHNIDNVAVVLAIYPVVAAAAFVATILPRARILAEAIAQEAVMIAMYYVFCMIIAEFGGFDQLERRSSESRIESRVLPCCCWPWCLIPRPKVNKRNLKILRYLVLQMPIIQGIIYILILILWAEDMALYQQCFIFIQPFIVASILTGVWGTIMTVKTSGVLGYNVRPKFLAVQLVLIIVKLQSALAKILPEFIYMPCILPMHPAVFVNMIHNFVMMLEMLLLAVWAKFIYNSSPGKDLNKAPRIVVAVLEDNARSLEVKAISDSFTSKSFNNNARNDTNNCQP